MRWSKLKATLLLQYLRTKEGATISKDQRHITKRCTREMCSRTVLEVAGGAISMTLLIGLQAKLGTSKEMGVATKETDFMPVKSALRSHVGCRTLRKRIIVGWVFPGLGKHPRSRRCTGS